METLFIFLVKSSGLIGVFFLSYHILLRKETFFNSNRWFLLAGLISSVVMPLVVFTKIVWVDPTPTNFDWSKIPMTTPAENEASEINWYLVFAIVYSIGILVFLIKIAFDFYSLSKVLKGKNIQHQADFKFIDVKENVSPFSYFNSIVYNSSLYSAAELENILEHEKVHSTQNHTIDVLISRLFCVVFWFNPLVWLYKNAIVQNLEFIADSEALKNISDKKAYQLTLLKITTQENCVAITNHFYQSLIKKRIVMLNKNQSNKRSSWKYAVIIPALVAFVFLFQVKVVAQERKTTKQEITNEETPFFIVIDKSTSEKDFKEYSTIVKSNYDGNLKFSKIKRNSNGEIIAIKVEFTQKDGRSGATEISGTKPIKTFYFIIKGDEMGFDEMGFERLKKSKNNGNVTVSKYPIASNISVTPNDVKSIKITDKDIFINDKKADKVQMEELNPAEIESIDVNKNSGKNEIRITTKKNSENTSEEEYTINGENSFKITNPNTTINQSADNFDNKKISKLKPIIILNGKKTEANFDISIIDVNQIETIKVLKGQKAIEKYGKEAEYGVIEIVTKGNVTLLKSSSKKEQDRKEDIQLRKFEIQARKDEIQSRKDNIQAKNDAIQAKIDAKQAAKDAEQAKKDAIQANIDKK